jgi:head-tail adaptor
MANLLQEEFVNAGELQKQVAYQVKTFDGTKDAHGNRGFTWTTSVNRWAFIKTVGARESVTTERLKIVASHLIICRFIPGANALGRFSYHNRLFNISYVNDVNERNIQHQFFVSEVINPV